MQYTMPWTGTREKMCECSGRTHANAQRRSISKMFGIKIAFVSTSWTYDLPSWSCPTAFTRSQCQAICGCSFGSFRKLELNLHSGMSNPSLVMLSG